MLQILKHLLRFKFLAGKNVYVEVRSPGKEVNADVTFGEQDKSGDDWLVGVWNLVLGYLRRGNLVHPDLCGIGVQEFINEFQIMHPLWLGGYPLNYQVHRTHPLSLNNYLKTVCSENFSSYHLFRFSFLIRCGFLHSDDKSLSIN